MYVHTKIIWLHHKDSHTTILEHQISQHIFHLSPTFDYTYIQRVFVPFLILSYQIHLFCCSMLGSYWHYYVPEFLQPVLPYMYGTPHLVLSIIAVPTQDRFVQELTLHTNAPPMTLLTQTLVVYFRSERHITYTYIVGPIIIFSQALEILFTAVGLNFFIVYIHFSKHF